MFVDRFGLKRTRPVNEPLVVFGCYTETDYHIIETHRAPLIMVWMGSDFALFGRRKVWEHANILHVAIGKWVERDLQKRGLAYRRLNLVGSPLVNTLQPEPFGDSVYTYLPTKRDEYYGGPLVRAVQNLLKNRINFIVHTGLDVAQRDMPAVYRKCFAGLRLTQHDGGSETVIEMGLMGRCTIHNGDTPASLPWADAEDIMIWLERLRCNKDKLLPASLAQRVQKHIQTNDEWLDLDWWRVA